MKRSSRPTTPDVIRGPWGATGADGGGTGPQSWTGEWVAAWNTFWFTPADPLPLAVVRIGTGCILAWSNLVWLADAGAFFGDQAWLPPADVWRVNDQPWQWSWYFAAPGAMGTWFMALAGLVAALLLAVGLCTPLAAIISLLGLISSVNRAPLHVFGLDDTLGLLLVPLAIGPAGAGLSVDRWLWPGKRGAPSVRANVALRLIQVHLCVVYGFSGCAKLLGASWWEGTAIWGAVANGQYRTLDLTWLARHPLVVNAITLGTVFWEVFYPALVWPRLTRRLALGMAVAVHLGIGLSMGMMEFALAMITANLAFVPARVFRRQTASHAGTDLVPERVRSVS